MSKKFKFLAVAVILVILAGGFVGLEMNKVKVTVENNTDTIIQKLYVSDSNGKRLLEIPPIEAKTKVSIKLPKNFKTERVRIDYSYEDKEHSFLLDGIDEVKKKRRKLVINAVYDNGLMDVEIK